ncbi:MAG: lipid A biosynthesis acyltransferase [Niastella sp.]|nr:lipid A biosynthesis acyltransferase [Niastella sp.]
MYYLIYGILYLFSLLPFFILYGISNVLSFLLYRILGYRREVVLQNLRIAFPDKTEQQLKAIARKFYRNLVDTFLESIKLLSLPAGRFDKRAVIDISKINEIAAKGKNIQLHSGHQMNWEYANYAVARNINIPFIGVYMRINNKALDKIFYNLRSKYGTRLVAAQEFKNRRHSVFQGQYALGLVADQNPGRPGLADWLYFFSKPAGFVTGPDKGARLNNTAVFFVRFIIVKRGFYRFEPILISENAAEKPEGWFTLAYRDFVEETIREQPDNYLWSHKRWKWQYEGEKKGRWIDVKLPPT